MVDEQNDVRIIGVITVCVLLGVAVIGMEWEARVNIAKLFLVHIVLCFNYNLLVLFNLYSVIESDDHS